MTAPARVRRTWNAVAIITLALGSGLAALAIQRNVFPLLSGDHDEAVYQYQARLLLDGHLMLSAAQQGTFFRPWLSGAHSGHLVLAFPLGWPAILAASQGTTRSMLPGLAIAASFATLGCYWFAHELLRNHRRALLVAALFALSPLTLLLSGTYLNYVFTLGLELVFGALFLRGARTRATTTFVLAGLALGAAFFTRPYDALLFALPLVGWVLLRDRILGARRPLGALLAGASPFLALTVVTNWITGGGPLAFSTSVQSHGAARFFWGYRSVASDIGGFNFSVWKAGTAFAKNLWAMPSWMFGTYVLVALAVLGAVVLRRRDAPEWKLLVAMVAVFPVGYLAWFASELTVNGAWNGLGPHYYLPMIVPLAILAGEGTVALVEVVARRARARQTTIAVVVVAIALTAAFVPAKLHDKRTVRKIEQAYTREVHARLAARTRGPAIVVLERGAKYVMADHVMLRNPPDLHAHVLYAVDRGPRVAELFRRYPDRRIFRIVRRVAPGGNLFSPNLHVEPFVVLRGREQVFTSRITNRSGTPAVAASVAVGDAVLSEVVVDRHSSRGRTYEVAWTLAPDGRLRYAVDGGPVTTVRKRAPRNGVLAVGAELASRVKGLKAARSELRYEYQRGRGAVAVVSAPESWQHFGGPDPGWLPIDVSSILSVEVGGPIA